MGSRRRSCPPRRCRRPPPRAHTPTRPHGRCPPGHPRRARSREFGASRPSRRAEGRASIRQGSEGRPEAVRSFLREFAVMRKFALALLAALAVLAEPAGASVLPVAGGGWSWFGDPRAIAI